MYLEEEREDVQMLTTLSLVMQIELSPALGQALLVHKYKFSIKGFVSEIKSALSIFTVAQQRGVVKKLSLPGHI